MRTQLVVLLSCLLLAGGSGPTTVSQPPQPEADTVWQPKSLWMEDGALFLSMELGTDRISSGHQIAILRSTDRGKTWRWEQIY